MERTGRSESRKPVRNGDPCSSGEQLVAVTLHTGQSHGWTVNPSGISLDLFRFEGFERPSTHPATSSRRKSGGWGSPAAVPAPVAPATLHQCQRSPSASRSVILLTSSALSWKKSRSSWRGRALMKSTCGNRLSSTYTVLTR